MKTRIPAELATIALLVAMTGCGSGETPNGQNAGGTTGAGGGTGATGAGGTNTAGSPAGGMQATGGAPATGGTGGSMAGGTAGASGSAPEGGTGAGMGGLGAMGGAGATAGSGTGGATATATFSVKSELASDVMASAPTTVGIVTWSVDVQSLTSASIDFGLTTAYGMRAPVDLAEMSYRTLLLGMKPASTYHFRISATAGSTNYVSGDYTLQTGAATTAVQIASFRETNATARKRGFIVTSYWNGNGSAVPFILDADGAIVWWATSGPSGIARASMSADGKNMWLISANNNGAPLMRVRMDGLERQTYSSTTGSHDITPVSGATMAYLDYSESDCNSIFEIDPSGTTREIWDSQGVVAASGCHGNALRYSQAENVYTFSDVRQDIFVVSRAGALQWRLSERTTGGNTAWGGTNHGHQLLDASILVFANVGGGQGASDFVEYNLMGQQIQRYPGGGFSANLGDVQRLPGGNTLITYSNDSLIREIDAQRNVVLDIDGGSSRFGYALWRETLYGPPPDISQ
jgi:hypothetical protein